MTPLVAPAKLPGVKKLLPLIGGAAIALLVLTGCMTTKKMNATMASWVGHHANDLIASWGPPQQVMSDGSGGQIFIYDRSGSVVIPGQSTTTTNFTGTGNATYNQYGNTGYLSGNAYGTAQTNSTYRPAQAIAIPRSRTFWVDRTGKIYRWAWQGL